MDWDGKFQILKKNLKEKKIFWNKSEKGESYIFHYIFTRVLLDSWLPLWTLIPRSRVKMGRPTELFRLWQNLLNIISSQHSLDKHGWNYNNHFFFSRYRKTPFLKIENFNKTNKEKFHSKDRLLWCPFVVGVLWSSTVSCGDGYRITIICSTK